MINRVVLVGRLTREPELRYTPNGNAVVTFTLAVNRTRTDKDGNRVADFINCIAWRKTAENIANYVKKGHQLAIDGQITTRNYKGKDGKRVYVTEVLAESSWSHVKMQETQYQMKIVRHRLDLITQNL